MATERQIEANRRNAARSTGPKTVAGKCRSRLNATRHGLAGESPEVEADASAEFAERRARWAAGHEPADEAARWALDRAVAASMRIERCERALDGLVTRDRLRAGLAWEEDRAVEAAEVAARLGKEPALTSRRLQTTRAGVEWLIEAWLGLIDGLDTESGWSEAETSMAMDLLGVPAERRGEAPGGLAVADDWRALATEEVERLEALRDRALTPIDEAERALARAGDLTLLSRPARLVLRYERDAWRRFREATRPASSPVAPTSAPTPTAIEPPVAGRSPQPATPAPAPIPEGRAIEEERRALLAEVAACGFAIPAWAGASPEDDDPAWLDEVERRVNARGPSPAQLEAMGYPAGDGTNPIGPAAGPRDRPDLRGGPA